MRDFEGTVYGALSSKANSRRITTFNGRLASVKSAGSQKYVQDAMLQLRALYKGRKPIAGDLVLEATVFYPTRRNDLDVSLFQDVLQLAEVIENDRQFKEMHLYHGLDKAEPRVEFAIWQREVAE